MPRYGNCPDAADYPAYQNYLGRAFYALPVTPDRRNNMPLWRPLAGTRRVSPRWPWRRPGRAGRPENPGPGPAATGPLPRRRGRTLAWLCGSPRVRPGRCGRAGIRPGRNGARRHIHSISHNSMDSIQMTLPFADRATCRAATFRGVRASVWWKTCCCMLLLLARPGVCVSTIVQL